MSKRFGHAIDKRYLPLLLVFGLRGSKDGVTLTDEGSLLATFGFVKIKTPLANVTKAHITRNYRWWTAFGVPQPRPITGSFERSCVQRVAIAGRHRETVSPSRGLARQPA
jgi:hypothetical protein